MNRKLTRRETVLLLILAVLVITLGYYNLIFQPIQEQKAQYMDNASQERQELDVAQVQAAQMEKMEQAVEAIRAGGLDKAIPQYDNSGALMRELYRILDSSSEYAVDFSAPTDRDGYIVLRPVSLSFQTETYQQARAIVDALADSGNLNQISDLSIRAGQGKNRDRYQTDLTITYFEVAP